MTKERISGINTNFIIPFKKIFMKKVWLLLPVLGLLLGCNKLEDLEGNNIPFKEKYFIIEEVISMVVPNDDFNFSGFLNCSSLPFGATQDYNAFIPTQNPNPYAYLVDDITPVKVKMELTNIPDCDFDMLESVEIFLVDLTDTCGNVIDDEAKFVFKADNITHQGSCSTVIPVGPYYNAMKIGEFLNFSSGVGSVIYLDVNPEAKIDQFIHAGNFQTYAKLVFDKAFTEESAIIQTTMELNVRLINAE
jgi:hypothetical protein